MLLHSNNKHEKAKQLSEDLKSQFNSVKEIVHATGEHERFVYRTLSSPRKCIQQVYAKKLSQERCDLVFL